METLCKLLVGATVRLATMRDSGTLRIEFDDDAEIIIVEVFTHGGDPNLIACKVTEIMETLP